MLAVSFVFAALLLLCSCVVSGSAGVGCVVAAAAAAGRLCGEECRGAPRLCLVQSIACAYAEPCDQSLGAGDASPNLFCM